MIDDMREATPDEATLATGHCKRCHGEFTPPRIYVCLPCDSKWIFDHSKVSVQWEGSRD